MNRLLVVALVAFSAVWGVSGGTDGLPAERRTAPKASLFDSKLFVQLDVPDLTVENRAQRLADIRASGADGLQLAICEFFVTGEARRKKLAHLKDMIAYFVSAGYPVAIWVSSLGYGEPKDADYERRFPNRRKLKSFGGAEAVMCATDETYAQALEENVRDFIRAGAKFILWDDDFVQACRPGLSCVCDAHLALYAKRLGRPVTADEVRQSFVGASNEVRKVFLDVMGETLETLAKRLRRAADEVDPSVGMGLCASYTHYGLDGVDMDRLVRTFQGKQQPRPFLRLSGAPYWAAACWPPAYRKSQGMNLAGVVEFARSQTARFRGSDVFVIDENDPYPRRSDKVPAGMCEVYDKALIADGGSVRNKYILRYGRDRVDTAYLDLHLADLPQDKEIAAAFRGTKPVGFRVYGGEDHLREAAFPETYAGEHELKALASFPFAGFYLVQNGVPTQYEREDTPGAAFGPAVLAVPRKAYARGLLIDLSAARELTRRGVDVGLREGASFWLHTNAAGEKFAVIGKDCLALKYGDLSARSDVPFNDVWRYFTGHDLPFAVRGGSCAYALVKEQADGTPVALLCNVRGEASTFEVVAKGATSKVSLPAWGFKVVRPGRR